MACFGVRVVDDGKEYIDAYLERMSNPLVQYFLDMRASYVSKDVVGFVINPRFPKLHYVGIILLFASFLFGTTSLWLLIPAGLLLSWWLFWHPWLYYSLMVLGKYKSYGNARKLEYLTVEEVMLLVVA